jgi:hypothetical protein
MTTYYATQYVGVRDGSVIPPNLCDGREVDAKRRSSRATLDPTKTYANGDVIYIGRLPQGAVVKSISLLTDTSLGTTTVSVGTLGTPAKYASAKTLTTTDVPTAIGPKAATGGVQAPLTTQEEIYATLGVGGIAANVNVAFNIEYTISA